jgi:hypothetical protein
MVIITGGSECPGCGRVIDAIDDIVAVSPHEAVRTVPVGAYHRECLALFPDRDRVVANRRDNVVTALRRRSASIAVVGQGRGYVIVFNSADEQTVLYYLNQMADQRFRDAARWRAFARLVKRFDPGAAGGQPEVASAPDTSALAVRPDGRVVVSWVEPVELEVDLAKADYDAFVARFGPLRGEVDFAELVAAGKLAPVEFEGSLEKNRGVVRDVRALGAVYVVSFDAPKRTELPLTVAEFRELQRAVASVKVLV